MTILIAIVVVLAVFGLGYAARRPKLAPPPPPPATPQQRKLLGLDTPGDQKFPVPARDWNALRLAVWRSQVAWDIATRAAEDVVDRCAHADGCPGKSSQDEPCLRECRDREVRMSALVVLGAARQLAPVDARRPADQPYFAPSRERYSETLSQLAAAEAELEVLRRGADKGVLDAIEAVLRTAPSVEPPARPKDTYSDLLVDNDVEEADENAAEAEENAE